MYRYFYLAGVQHLGATSKRLLRAWRIVRLGLDFLLAADAVRKILQ
jgi:hypothetical protein